MKGERFVSWSPLEVGDKVRMSDVKTYGYENTVTDILTIHRARRNDVQICYELDGRGVVPLKSIRCRLVDGREVPISEEKTTSERMA